MNTIADIDLVTQARTWAKPFADPSVALDPLVALDVDTAEGRLGAAEKVAVMLFQQLVAAVALPDEIELESPLVDGLVCLYAHKDFGISLRKLLGARTIRLQDDPTLDVAAKVQAIADADDSSYSADRVLSAFASQLKLVAGHMEYADGVPFFEQYTADGSGCQRALAVAAIFDARGRLA